MVPGESITCVFNPCDTILPVYWSKVHWRSRYLSACPDETFTPDVHHGTLAGVGLSLAQRLAGDRRAVAPAQGDVQSRRRTSGWSRSFSLGALGGRGRAGGGA